MSEWFKEHAWKVCVGLIPLPRVRIPLSPPLFKHVSRQVGSIAGWTMQRERVRTWVRQIGRIADLDGEAARRARARMARVNPSLSAISSCIAQRALPLQWWPLSAPATISRKLRQGRKAATVLADSGAGASRQGLPPSRSSQNPKPPGFPMTQAVATAWNSSSTCPPTLRGSNGIGRFGCRGKPARAATLQPAECEKPLASR
jgi:hypothetical protein